MHFGRNGAGGKDFTKEMSAQTIFGDGFGMTVIKPILLIGVVVVTLEVAVGNLVFLTWQGLWVSI